MHIAQLHSVYRAERRESLKMALRVWLLVEWVDESNVFPAYGVVNIDTRAYNDSELYPGNLILISVQHENAKRAKILRISENKRYVYEHKEILERQDQQVKNMLQICMRSIQEIKSEQYNTAALHQNTAHNVMAAHVVIANSNNSTDSDSETIAPQQDQSMIHNVSSFNTRHSAQYSRAPQPFHRGHSFISNHQKRRSIISSTPLPGSTAPDNIKLSFDQGTQTEDASDLQIPTRKIEELESVIKNLYRRFNSLAAQADCLNVSLSISESEHNDVSYIEPNGESWVDDNNTGYKDQGNETYKNAGEQVVEQFANNTEEPINLVSSNIKVENVPTAVRVRRMSAQTTIDIDTPSKNADLVPIGSGYARVPARLLNDIDWTSHTNATRQLLQAIFPRRVLATHSLTGKQSPAFLDKPPKKILDPKLVDDIVKQVSTRCGVPQRLVRNSITIKCTDEAKLYRNRQLYKQGRKPLQQNIQNEENIPPPTPSSDELSNVMD